jgi:hypothetical protein
MGKLHKLRRAIEREPEKWMSGNYARPASNGYPYEGHWHPHWNTLNNERHRLFVRSVLRKLGYMVK